MSEKLPKGWKRVNLGEVVDSVSETFKFNSKPVVFLNTSDIYAGKVLNHKLINPKNLPGQAKKCIRKGDLLFSEIRPINKRYARITFDVNNYVVSTKLMVLRSKGEIDPIFLELFLTCEETLEYLQMIAEDRSGTFPQITFDVIKNLEIFLPPLPEQKAIASVLSSLDDKIDLLYRQNQTLEQIAQTLFRKWFIEDAKEDWEEVKLGDFFPIITGKKNANFATDDGEYPFFTCSQQTLKAPYYSFEGHAILLAGNGDFNVKRYKGKFEAYQRTYVLIPYDDKYVGFLYSLIKFFLPEITGAYQGSVIRFITKGMIENFKFKFPNNRNDNKLNDRLKNLNEIYEKIDFNLTQIRTLENLRDTLLPKLMSGKVRVNF